MIEIMGKKFISEKEASKRYGYSIWWFRDKRKKKYPPKAIKFLKGKILYPLNETDEWFQKNMVECF